ncbi:GDSL-type esterase/lipase family protein [Secundilactobacillus folii]|uniref:SGNH hydrolase-type esterase domain-containing protein n=1 Tax=Secundilactobacillus folii TaxID=2678357 RepID=A0A7X2XU90_9LACO|nr:GDSL-type esterase/lipase family protein [Secundilactobacillus folii]MTV81190.1 hypothetical protein [Secundilactobacillus folii]
MRRLYKFIIGIVVVLAVLAGGWFWWQSQQTSSSMPAAVKRVIKPRTVRIVAVGDSLTQGIGYDNDHQGYLPILKQALNKKYYVKTGTANYGIGGQRSDQIDKRIRQNTKLRQSMRRANIVTLTAGGNDLLQNLEKNILVSSDSQLTKKMAPLKTQYQQKLTNMIRDVRTVNPRAQIYLFGIYNPVYVYFTNAKMISTQVNQWNRVNQTVAETMPRTYFVNVNQQLTYGQYQSASAQAKLQTEDRSNNQAFVDPTKVEKLLQTQDSKEKNAYLSTHDHFHPNRKGYQVMANKLMQAISKHVTWRSR